MSVSLDQVGEFAARLETAITELRGHGVLVAEASRLPLAARLLRKVFAARRYPTAPSKRLQVLHALRDAAEWYAIAGALRPTTPRELLEDVQRAVGGQLVPSGGENLRAQQLQSQLHFGALLTASGTNLGTAEKKGFPDYAVNDGNLVHGLEVKSPRSGRRMRDHVKEADDQLGRYSGCGMLVMDLSLVLQSRITEELGEVDQATFERAIRTRIDPLYEDLWSCCHDHGSWRRDRGLAALCVLARVSHWLDDGPTGSLAIRWRRFYRVEGTLTFWRATMLGDRVATGLRAVDPTLDTAWEDEKGRPSQRARARWYRWLDGVAQDATRD